MTLVTKNTLNNFAQEATDFLKDVVIILVIVLIVRTFFIMPFQINGASMMDSYYDREFIIVDRLSYRNIPYFGSIREVRRGDVVIFTPGVSEERKYFIKRVIGLPGDTIKLEGGEVYLQEDSQGDFIELEEDLYLSNENEGNTNIRGNTGEVTYVVPDNRYFVLWDNRTHSTDSRTCFWSCSLRTEYISDEEITGRLLLDLGYFHIGSFSFTHPNLDISTAPRFFGSPWTHNY